MYRMKTSDKRIHTLVITVELNRYVSSDVAASKDITIVQRSNIPPDRRYSEEQLEEYTIFIRNIVAVVRSHHFRITRSKQSNESYSYYLDFYPLDEEGQPQEKVKVVFRIADHPISSPDFDEEQDLSETTDGYLKNFQIGSTRYPNAFRVRQAVDEICDELAVGNYDALDWY